ncbi:DUF302 domain-containing protein [Virgibacillus doumboii]|uniref:DUF302 domain-containing protein n=1 Tax=Virgibacillus doumboii TaxID=2697503 RepID=UPI0013DFB8AA|nr:DUF302 domain-containing protein [Virgibacillus doumboii]
MFHYTVETKKSMEEIISALEESLKEEQFGVLWQFNIKETLKNKGFEFEQPYQVLEVCNPKEANNVLTENQLAGYFLPCKIVVYQDVETNKTKIGMPKPTALIEMVNDESLNRFAADIENRLIACIDKII